MAEQFGKTQLLLGDGDSPEVFTQIADARDIQPPGIQTETEDVTNHDDPDHWRRHKPTLQELTELTALLFWDPASATHDDVLAFIQARTTHNFRLRFPTNPILTWLFAGALVALQPETPIDEHLKLGITVRPTGAVTPSLQAYVAGVDDTGADGPAYVTGEDIEVTVTFSRAVTVTGTPRITLTLDSGAVVLSYISGSGSTALVFSIEAAGGHQAEAGEFEIAAQSINLNGGTIIDSHGYAARLSFTAAEVADISDRTVNAA